MASLTTADWLPSPKEFGVAILLFLKSNLLSYNFYYFVFSNYFFKLTFTCTFQASSNMEIIFFLVSNYFVRHFILVFDIFYQILIYLHLFLSANYLPVILPGFLFIYQYHFLAEKTSDIGTFSLHF